MITLRDVIILLVGLLIAIFLNKMLCRRAHTVLRVKLYTNIITGSDRLDVTVAKSCSHSNRVDIFFKSRERSSQDVSGSLHFISEY